jgi:ribonuclease HI
VLLTKRNVLKTIATIFDPLGLISQFVVIAIILLQELWSRGYDWDDVIADEVADKIEMWFRQLLDLENVRVPRCLREAKTVLSQSVITFVDASLKAYGAVVYLKCEYEDTTTSCRMIASKTKVAPLKPMTVPRLELMGAILGLRLTQRLIPILEIPMRMVTFYSDSTDVLWWIRGHSSVIHRKPHWGNTNVDRASAMATRAYRRKSGGPLHKRSNPLRIIRSLFMGEWTKVVVRGQIGLAKDANWNPS